MFYYSVRLLCLEIRQFLTFFFLRIFNLLSSFSDSSITFLPSKKYLDRIYLLDRYTAHHIRTFPLSLTERRYLPLRPRKSRRLSAGAAGIPAA